MKEYHTAIQIHAPVEKVWKVLTDFQAYSEWNPLVSELKGDISEGGLIYTSIVPLKKTYAAKLISFKEKAEIVWKGKQVAAFLIAGEHYYRLKELESNLSLLEHGEYFTGILSNFISNKQLTAMENAFTEHNEALKQRVENGK